MAECGLTWDACLDMTPSQIDSVIESLDMLRASRLDDRTLASCAPWSKKAGEAVSDTTSKLRERPSRRG